MKDELTTRPVLLVNPNRMQPPIGPLGIELVADGLARSGIETEIADLAFTRRPLAALREAIQKHRPLAVGVTVRNLDDCYFASQSFLLPPLRRLVKTIRETTDAPVVLGGVGFSIAPVAALEYLAADYGLRGDGEESFPALVRGLARGREPEGIPGLVAAGKQEPAPARAELRDLPLTSRSRVDLGRYFRRGGQANLETSRGCNRACIYCADPVAKGRQFRTRDPESAAVRMKYLSAQGVHTFHWCDSEINLDRGHLEAVCRAVIKAGLAGRVRWYGYALPRPLDRSLAALMAKAGCAGIDFSVDAADEQMLQTLGRDFQVDDLAVCAKVCRAAGITFMFDLLLGGPGETNQTMKRTISRIKKIRPDRVGISFGVRVFPQTRLAALVRAAGPLAENPCLHGAVDDNDDLLRPVFYVADALGPRPEAELKRLVDDDPMFFFASREEVERNYNYNNNLPLCRAIRKGARGAYWDILRKLK